MMTKQGKEKTKQPKKAAPSSQSQTSETQKKPRLNKLKAQKSQPAKTEKAQKLSEERKKPKETKVAQKVTEKPSSQKTARQAKKVTEDGEHSDSSTPSKAPNFQKEKTTSSSFKEDLQEERGLFQRLTELTGGLADLTGGLAGSAFKFAAKTSSVGRSFFHPEQQRRMMETGLYLQDLRKVAGITLSELSEAIDLEDKSLLEAVENGTATLSFELILRISAHLARHDPIPSILKFTRAYNPRVWSLLDNWGASKIPLQFERERRFVNILRKHDVVRGLNDAEFEKLLDFTSASFDMALQFIADVNLEKEESNEEKKEETHEQKKKPPIS